MEKEPSSSFNIVLSPDISERLRAVQKEISEVVKEQRNYDTSPHLAITTKFMGQPLTDAFAASLVEEFGSDTAWELEFADFSPSATGNYIFLNLAEPSRRRLFEMHERALAASRGIGNEEQNGALPKYAYDPHISIVKLRPEEVTKALELIVHDLSGITMPVTTLQITRQENLENGSTVFPVVAKMTLKS